MKHTAFVDQEDGIRLKEKVAEWIRENEDRILEIVDIEYSKNGSTYLATITYLD